MDREVYDWNFDDGKSNLEIDTSNHWTLSTGG